MTAPTIVEGRHNGNPVGERVELGRYTLPAGERVLYGQRVYGVVRLVDAPLCGPGRRYLVERELEQDGYAALLAVVADYLAQSKTLGEIPAAHSPVECYLETLDCAYEQADVLAILGTAGSAVVSCMIGQDCADRGIGHPVGAPMVCP